MKTKHYDILDMDVVTLGEEERLPNIMRQIGDLPLAEHLFDVDEMKKIADELGPLVEETIRNMLDRAERLAGDTNRCAGAAFLYVAGQALRAHADHYAQGAIGVLANEGTDLLRSRLGADGLDRLIDADMAKNGNPAQDIINLLTALGIIQRR